jgi:hypothetical protein
MMVIPMSWVLALAVFLWCFWVLPAPASGWRGGLGRFLQSGMMAAVVWLIVIMVMR